MKDDKSSRPEFLVALLGSWVGLLGIVVAVCSLFAAIFLIVIDLFHGFRRPYMGLMTYVALPSFIWIGLVIAGSGVWLERRRAKKGKTSESVESNGRKRVRQISMAIVFAFFFLLLSSLGSYRAFQVTDSPQFCGALCHTVMKPEYAAYKVSPHARVACVECHIGPGASWFVRSKLSGLYQVYAVATNSFPRPIPVPVENLRPARQTCEQCHWPNKFYGWVEVRHHTFLPDKANTPFNITMLLHVGGANPTQGPVGGIHWHMIVSNRMEYIATDRTRQTIPWVRVTNRKTGAVTVYESKENPLTPQQKNLPKRVLDCVDCHNRPTHIFRSPYDALDVSMWLGRIDPSIPWIKMKAAEALIKAEGTVSQSQGADLIARTLSTEFSSYQDHAKLTQAISETQTIFRQNFFPQMKTDWKVRPDNIGHFIWKGCFRCHDGLHVDKAGQAIPHACNTCHIIAAQGNKPAQSQCVTMEGLKFDHPGGNVPPEFMCNQCHTGAP